MGEVTRKKEGLHCSKNVHNKGETNLLREIRKSHPTSRCLRET